MSIYSFPKIIKFSIIILFILGIAPLFAQEKKSDTIVNYNYTIPKDLSELQRQARLYRSQGLELQQIGNLDGAMSLYQKAIELDPSYAIVYNDLGIIYEAKGLIDLAEENYLKAINIDPNFLSAYSNLALLFESKRNLERAAFYWERRVELGSGDDLWTQRARQHLEDICLVLGRPNRLETVDLTRDVLEQKNILAQDDKEVAKKYLEKAKQSYQKGDQLAALKQAVDALLLDSSNKEIEDFIAKVQTRLLTR